MRINGVYFVPVYAANAGDGAGPGSHGDVTMGASSMICSEPQTPHRFPLDVETVSQFSQ
jgi:hypothetical protein